MSLSPETHARLVEAMREAMGPPGTRGMVRRHSDAERALAVVLEDPDVTVVESRPKHEPACPRCGDPGYDVLGRRYCGNHACENTDELPVNPENETSTE